MIRRIACTLAIAAATVAPLASNAMSIFGRSDNSTSVTSVPKGKMVKMTLKNRTATAMTLTVNDQPVTIAAGAEFEVKALDGSNIYDADRNVKVHVTRELGGTTVSFR